MIYSLFSTGICSRNGKALLLLFMWQFAGHANAQTAASQLFDSAQSLVYQIRVIDLASGDKFSTGSGFKISAEGHVATNYHVVSSFVHEPEKYRLESVAYDDSVEPLVLLSIDVVHDLAIVSTEQDTQKYLPLSQTDLAKGDRIYSMGSPLELGMTIIEGTYNGLVENSRYRKILFSGSLNAGMSGGPALNAQGDVVGINVSKGGEQLSFLVPVEHLVSLLEDTKAGTRSSEFITEITADLLADQQAFYQTVLEGMNSDRHLGDLSIPDKLEGSLNCWGHSVDEEDIFYEAAHQHCKSEDVIFVSSDIYVGNFRYDFELMDTQVLNRFQFYTLLETRFDHRSSRSAADIDEVSAYRCHDDELALESGTWKISTCMRAYKKFSGLLDASMVMVSVDHSAKAAVVRVTASGISSENALTLFREISEAVAWTH
jgi:serine protease Do